MGIGKCPAFTTLNESSHVQTLKRRLVEFILTEVSPQVCQMFRLSFFSILCLSQTPSHLVPSLLSLGGLGQCWCWAEEGTLVGMLTARPGVALPALGGVGSARARVPAAAAARMAPPAQPARLRRLPPARHPERAGVLPWTPQQGVCLPVAQPQAGRVWDQV